MSETQSPIPPYLKVAAAALSAEVLGVSHLTSHLLEAGEAVQLKSQLACGPNSEDDKRTIKKVYFVVVCTPGWWKTCVSFLQHSLDCSLLFRAPIPDLHGRV